MSLIAKLVLGTLYLVGAVKETNVYGAFGDYKTVPYSPKTEDRLKRETKNPDVCHPGDISYDYINGYETTEKGINLTVTFSKVDRQHNANVSWDRPTDNNRSKCIGYRVNWLNWGIFTDQYCKIIKNENITHLIVNITKEMEEMERFAIAVFPLPQKTKRPTYKMHWFRLSKATTAPPRESSTSSSTSMKPVSTKPNANISASSSKNVQVVSSSTIDGRKKSGTARENTMATWVIAIIIVSAAIVSITIVLAIFRVYRVTTLSGTFILTEETYNKTSNAHYVSYYSDNDKVTETAIRIASWLKQQNLNVIMDKLNVITDGMRKWCDRNISLAKKVILIISPGYLKISKLDETINPGKEKELSLKDQLAYNEVCHIRDEIMKMPLVTHRFVVILVETGYNELPFWMKHLNVYKYSGGKVDENILKVLK